MKLNNLTKSYRTHQSVQRSAIKNFLSVQHPRIKKILNRSATHSETTHAPNKMEAPLKHSMENLFQQDFSSVKVNTQSTKAQEIGANAYTQGNEIHFSPGLYNPKSQKGKRLIAHELTHVVQQNRNQVKPTNLYQGNPVNDNSLLEREADQMGQQAIRMDSSNTLNSAWSNNINKPQSQPTLASVQTIQKQDNQTGFDIDYSFLPPSLQLRLWVLSLDANTSRVRLSRDFGTISAGLNYNYGGALSADISTGGFRGRFGVDPSNANLSLGGSYGGFNVGATGNIGQRSFGLNLGYGSSLLPFPAQLSSVFTSGAQSLGNIAGDISAAPDNPLAWYDLHSDDISTITSAVNMGRRIHSQQTSTQNFGAGLRLSYSPEAGFMIYGGVQLIF